MKRKTGKSVENSNANRDTASEQNRLLAFWQLGGASGLAALLVSLAVYGSHVSMQLVIYVLIPRCWRLGAVAVGCVISALLINHLARSYARVALRIAAIVYYPVAFLTLAVAGVMVWLIDPLLTSMIIVWVGCFAFWRYRAVRLMLLPLQGLWLVLLAVALGKALPGTTVPLVGGVVVYLLLLALLWRSDRIAWAISAPAMMLFVLATFVNGALLWQYRGIFPERAAAIMAQPGVKQVFSYENVSDLNAPGVEAAFAVPLNEGVLISSHGANPVVVYAPNNGDMPERIDIGGAVGNTAVFDPNNSDTVYLGGWDRLYRAVGEPPRFETFAQAQVGMVNMLRLHPQRPEIYAAADNGDRVVRFALDQSGKVEVTAPVEPRRYVYDVVIDPVSDSFYASVMGTHGVSILEGSAKTLSARRETLVPRANGFLLDIDPEGRRLFVASFFTSEVVLLSLPELTEIDRVALAGAICHVTWDAQRRLLWASSYFSGDITAYDPALRQIVAQLNGGPTTRYLSLSRNGKTMAWRSAAGVFVMDIDRALADGANPPQLQNGVRFWLLRHFSAAALAISKWVLQVVVPLPIHLC